MCGIMGYNFKKGAIEPARRAILANNLARLNDRRGGDSWGVATIINNEINVARGLGDMMDHAFHFIEGDVMFGHTRYATMGAKTIENAHPFAIGNIVGAHNGMLYNHHDLKKKYKRECEVDSMHLFHHLNEGRSFSDIEGYGAIEWVNRKDLSSIYLSRLKNGSLTIMAIGTKDNVKGIVWSSDDKHLLEALYCAGINEYFPYKVEEGALYFVKDGDAYLATGKKLELAARNSTTSYKWEDNSHTYVGSKYSGGKHGGAGYSASNFPDKDQSHKDLSEWREWNNFCKSKEKSHSYI